MDGISSFVGFIFYFALDLFEPLFLFFMLPLSRILPMDVIFLTACGTIMLWFYTGLYLCGLIRVLKVNTLLETENKDSFLFAKRVLSFLLKGIFGIAYFWHCLFHTSSGSYSNFSSSRMSSCRYADTIGTL